MSSRLAPGGFHLVRSRAITLTIAAIAVAVIIAGSLWIAAVASSAAVLQTGLPKQIEINTTAATQQESIPRVTQYRVIPGNTLNSISQHLYGKSACWPGIYDQNEKVIGNDPGAIKPGEVLLIPASCTMQLPNLPEVHVSANITPSRVVLDASVTASASSSFQACVIRAESGGNPVAQNPVSTASGLYGFLNTTWTAVMGIPGPARAYSVAMQNEAFERLYAEAGTSPWGPYDGC